MELYADDLELGAGEGRSEQVRRMLDTAEFPRVQRAPVRVVTQADPHIPEMHPIRGSLVLGNETLAIWLSSPES